MCISKDVPTATFIGNFTSNTKVGINKKPPPAPKRPVASPMAIPYDNNFGRFIFLSPAVLSIVSSFLLLIIDKEAITISIANNTIIAIDWVILKLPIVPIFLGMIGIKNLRVRNTVVIEDNPKS